LEKKIKGRHLNNLTLEFLGGMLAGVGIHLRIFTWDCREITIEIVWHNESLFDLTT
jgi:hypothetical protein